MSCLISLLFGFGVTRTLAQLAKFRIGRLRPDFLQRCIPDQEDVRKHYEQDLINYGHIIAHDFICTGDPNVVKEGRQSFPSGHALSVAYTFAFCTFLAYFWSLIAIYISSSRISDNRHNLTDVISGFAFGLIGGLFSGYLIWAFEYADNKNDINNMKETEIQSKP
ncbi:MAG: phosphatidate phosphatase [Streblomastix strix]|uniref:Phosphatidate phosphatase n=1 Tax=Streblomastix strix TaxID=222440 RepID=A0A5J4UZM7_9EUKA|nr:MAG: phosphatidate phosphatase [Streblomastix strix]